MQRKRQRRWLSAIATVVVAAVTAVGATTATHATTSVSSAQASPAAVTPWPPSPTFTNPVLWEDLADADVLRVGDTYYYSASTMHYSPGAPILRSYDLVHWEFAGHSVPSLDFGAKYDLNGNGRAYVNGVWASFLNYRKSNGTFYWGGCIDFNKTYIYTATSVDRPLEQRSVINNCYYDAGMLVDDNDTMYVAYGSGTHSVAQLSADGLSQVRTQTVFTDPSSTGTTEGNRMYKVNGDYYILVDHPANAEYVLKSTNGPFGPYTEQPLLNNVGTAHRRRRRSAPGRDRADAERRLVLHGLRRLLPGRTRPGRWPRSSGTPMAGRCCRPSTAAGVPPIRIRTCRLRRVR